MSDIETQESAESEDGFDSLIDLEAKFETIQAETSSPDKLYGTVGLADKLPLTDFSDIPDLLSRLMHRENLASEAELAEFLDIKPEVLAQALTGEGRLSKKLFLSLVALPALGAEQREKLLSLISPEEPLETRTVGDSVTLEGVLPAADRPPARYVALPQKSRQWDDKALSRFVRYEAKLFDLAKPDDREQYSHLITEWRKGFSAFKVVGRQVVFNEADKSVFIELEHYEFLDLEGGKQWIA